MIINPISKGGKGLLPEIIVTAPSGSTLDLMQGSVVLQTYTLSSTETQHTFTVKSTGTYTVRGTSGSDTASVEVVVDAIGQFSCTIQQFNGLRLYWLGDECEDATGGWQWGYTQNYGSVEISKESDHVHMKVDTGNYSTYVHFIPYKQVDISNYTKFKAELSYTRGNIANTGYLIIGISSLPIDTGTNYRNSNNFDTQGVYTESIGSDGVIELDISLYDGSKTIFFVADSWDSYIDLNLYKLWLE